MRREFELTEQQYQRLLDACKPTPAMWGSGGAPMFASPQENANRAWKELGRELGFVWNSASPIPGKGPRFFVADAL